MELKIKVKGNVTHFHPVVNQLDFHNALADKVFDAIEELLRDKDFSIDWVGVLQLEVSAQNADINEVESTYDNTHTYATAHTNSR